MASAHPFGFVRKHFERPGPVASAFMRSRARVVGIMGPQGSGKTAAVCVRVLQKAAMQPPSPIDGIARYRAVFWMRTYRELWAKIIPDWLVWVPQEDKSFGIRWNGGKDNPAEHLIPFEALDPATGHKWAVRCEVWFRAIGDQSPFEAAKGLHMTDGFLPEATSATDEMRKALFGRLGRYPAAEHGGAPHRQLFCDWNAGDPYNWTTKYFITERTTKVDDDGRPMVEFFRQPGGREAGAENLRNLVLGYYDDQVLANADDPDWIRRMVDNRIGFMRDGQPVFDAFDEELHIADELRPWKGVPLVLAADAGLTPAVVIGQANSLGERRILAEITSTRADAETIAEQILLVLDSPRFADLPMATELFIDPSAVNATESSARDSDGQQLQSWAQIVAAKTKLKVRPSRCHNNTVIRQNSVNGMFRRRVGGRPVVLIDRRHCPELIKACARDYKFARVQVVSGAGVEFHDKPLKNFASHVANALEYWAANVGEQDLSLGRETRAQRLDRMRAERARATAGGPSDPLSGYRRRA